MKKMFLSFFLLGSLLLVSCSGNSPKEVAEKFMNALRAADIEEAQKYCDEPTAKMLISRAELLKGVAEEERKENGKVGVFTVTRVEMNGDTAKAFFKDGSIELPLALKKVDGKWIVSDSAKEVQPGMSAPAEETETPTEAPAEAPAEPAEAK